MTQSQPQPQGNPVDAQLVIQKLLDELSQKTLDLAVARAALDMALAELQSVRDPA